MQKKAIRIVRGLKTSQSRKLCWQKLKILTFPFIYTILFKIINFVKTICTCTTILSKQSIVTIHQDLKKHSAILT